MSRPRIPRRPASSPRAQLPSTPSFVTPQNPGRAAEAGLDPAAVPTRHQILLVQKEGRRGIANFAPVLKYVQGGCDGLCGGLRAVEPVSFHTLTIRELLQSEVSVTLLGLRATSVSAERLAAQLRSAQRVLCSFEAIQFACAAGDLDNAARLGAGLRMADGAARCRVLHYADVGDVNAPEHARVSGGWG
mgnify:CR=1 FL=1